MTLLQKCLRPLRFWSVRKAVQTQRKEGENKQVPKKSESRQKVRQEGFIQWMEKGSKHEKYIDARRY